MIVVVGYCDIDVTKFTTCHLNKLRKKLSLAFLKLYGKKNYI